MTAVLGFSPLREHLEHPGHIGGDLPGVFKGQRPVRPLLPEPSGVFEELLPGLAHPKVEIPPDGALASPASTFHLGMSADGGRSIEWVVRGPRERRSSQNYVDCFNSFSGMRNR